MNKRMVIAANDTAQHKLFRSEGKLSPEEINNLLGIRVALDHDHKVALKEREEASCNRMLQFAVLMIAVVTIALLGSMYQLKIGPFYESKVVASSSLK